MWGEADVSKKLIPGMELFRFFAEIAEWKNKFLLVSKTFVGKRFPRNGAFRGMEWECAERVMKFKLSNNSRNFLNAGCFSGLNLKGGDWECSVPAFFGRGNEMEIGRFEVVSKTFVVKRFSRNGALSAE